MRPPADYVAIRDVRIPNSYAFAAREGDDITEAQRVNLGLTVGVDLRPLRTDSMAQPDDDADRREWQDYAVVRGVPYSEAVNLDLADLRKRIDAEEAERGDDADQNLTAMPDPGDLKVRWQEYAHLAILREVGSSVPEQTVRTRLGELTKAELIDTFGADADADRRAAFVESLRT